MSTILARSDGLYISTQVTWPQLATDETLNRFANGLISTALNDDNTSETLAEVLHQSGPHINPLLTVLLILDAEINAVVNDKQPVFPLPGFLTYRSKLPLDKFPLKAIRLPPLKPNSHYMLTAHNGFCTAVRMDLQPTSNIAHVRIAISSPTRPPIRLPMVEHHLERQFLNKELIQAAIVVANEDLLKPLTQIEKARLAEVLERFIED